MLKAKLWTGMVVLSLIIIAACTDTDQVRPLDLQNEAALETNSQDAAARKPAETGALTANGWYEGEEIYYIHNGVEEGVTSRGENDIYLIGGDRAYQANVVEFIPGEPGYSPHWNVYLVNTAEGVTLYDILASPYVSEHYDDEGVLFDDVEDLRGAMMDGLITFTRPGVVVNCPIISEKGAEAPGNTELPEEFPPFPETF